ncbi:hypothetical protein MHI37_30425 [Paenibacillus sp. FSL H8-0548]|uniref:hypothetical protein n=1 Tax=Paenibacillus sp. FSL H8-0548 TaxID=1920422 RepID=UPI00117C89E0|nr:hypothetical protein [Paenibacillus sp. FSL H8-0548]
MPRDTAAALSSEVSSVPRTTLTESEYVEYNPLTEKEETKKGYVFKTNDSGISKRMDTDVLRFVENRRTETEALLTHSYKVIDAYILGTAETQGLGDFALDPFEVEQLLNDDWEQFKTLYADELERAKSFVKESGEMNNIPWGRKNDGGLLSVVFKVDTAYAGAIDNLSWSNTEVDDEMGIDEEKEHATIREFSADTRFIKARDILQRYVTYMFGDKMTIEGVKSDARPIPEENLSMPMKTQVIADK